MIPPATAAAGEQHGKKQEPAAEEHGGKKTVFVGPDPVAQHTNEPQEGNACERQQVQSETDGFPAMGNPRPCILRIGGDGNPDEHQTNDEQSRKHDTGDSAQHAVPSSEHGSKFLPVPSMGAFQYTNW